MHKCCASISIVGACSPRGPEWLGRDELGSRIEDDRGYPLQTYIVKGVRKGNSSDVTLEIPAESEANARAKAEMQDIVVTGVQQAIRNSQTNPTQSSSPTLKPGESIDKGYCTSCGDVPVKTSGKGYHPRWYGVLFHLFMVLITVGGWIAIWAGWAIGHLLFRQGERRCLNCGQLLQKD